MSSNQYPLPFEMLQKWAAEIPDQVYLRQPVNRIYKEKTWREVHNEALRLAAAFRSLGLQPGDVVAILGKNTAEWFVADFAISMAGLISAPIYFTAGEDTIRFILQHSEAKAIVLGKLDDLGPASKAVPQDIIKIGQPYETVPCNYQMEALIAQNEPLADVSVPSMDDTFSVIYTSGSTGNPKGVELTYRNIGFGGTRAVSNLAFTPQDRLFSYLPLAHITERSMVEYTSLNHGCTVTFNESLETFQEDLRSANPSMFISVPRLWMKFQSGILAKIPPKRLSLLLKVPIVRSLVKKKIKAQLGLTNARLCGSGAAPISPAVLEWYCKLDIPISEGFGMSETSGLATSNYPFAKDKIGTVGLPAEGVEVKFSEAGELLIRSDGVVKGYYKDAEKSAETIVDGWLHTGDKGDMDVHGYVRITGRVKEIFKSGKGKYITPVPIEGILLENSYIEQICVMGSGLPQPVAVVVLSEAMTKNADMEVIKRSLVVSLHKTNDRLEVHQKLDSIIIAKDPWTIESGLLTPTMKIKRGLLEKKYDDLINSSLAGSVVVEQ